MARVAVGLSGGVDSSTAFLMLHEAGHEVFGITMRHLPKEMAKERVGSCCAPSSVAGASRLADSLGVPHYVFGLEDEFAASVMSPTARTLAAGITPNPCIWCNERVKFDALFRRAAALGADFFATGHYARVRDGKLYRAVDKKRDQSYFLYRLKPEILLRMIFPLGELTKEQVREKAHELGLEMADKEDSMDICFAPDGDFSEALKRFAPDGMTSGDILDEDGKVLGQHEGLGHYTVGQRRGLGVATGRRSFVRRLDSSTNSVVLGDRPKVWTFSVGDLIDHAVPDTTFRATIRIRSQHRGTDATIVRDGNSAHITPDEPLFSVTPGQSAVFYSPDECVLGGGIITDETARA